MHHRAAVDNCPYSISIRKVWTLGGLKHMAKTRLKLVAPDDSKTDSYADPPPQP